MIPFPSPLSPYGSPAGPGGFVSLVGAGPGDPELLTVKGLRRLREADVVLADALPGPAFRELAGEAALYIDVGKRCGRDSMAQERIHELLVEHALQGRRVVRLKGGDPLLYGRGFEEALAVAAAGIPFEVIPGVSSLQAGAAAAGISLTHRGVSDSLRVLQGHHLLERPRDWATLVQPGQTLVLFMATAQLVPIARRLLEHGAPGDLPLVLAEGVGHPGTRITRSTLAQAAAGRVLPRAELPGILYLGEAAGLRIPAHDEA